MDYSMADLASVRAFLRTACDSSVPLDRLEATYIQAGADGPTRVLYEMPAGNGTLLLAARRLRPTKGFQIEAAINARTWRPHAFTGFTQPALYAPALELLFHVFPADADLPGLPAAVDGSAMAPTLTQLLAERVAAAHLRSVAVQVMRYKPGRKCLLRYDLAWDGDDRLQLPSVAWARLARRSKFERTRYVLPRLRAADGDVGFDLPESYGVVPELSMEFFGPVPGVVVFARVQDDDFPAICRRVGSGLRRFHALPVHVEDTFDVQAQTTRLTENAQEFMALLPGHAARIADIERELRTRLCARSAPLSLIHRDFHGDNILISDAGQLALLDFEDCAMGDPADDVGSNWAQLTWHVHKAGARRAGPAAGREAFLEGYLAIADGSTTSRVPLYAGLHAFLYAHQCLRHPRDVARHEDALEMLTACERVLERGLG
jgi:hypothetical protein